MLGLANQKLAAASTVLLQLLARCWAPLHRLLKLLMGSWQPPAWMAWVGCQLVRLLAWLQQRLAWVLIAALVVALSWWASPSVLKWWHGLTPEQVPPQQVSATMEAPNRTRIESDALFNPARLRFSAEAAPIEQIGQAALDIRMEPALAGQWTWTQADLLEFKPEQDWPVGQKYLVRLGKKTLASHVEIAQDQYEFSAPAFVVNLEGAEFYQDPTQADVRRALFTLRFSHPVNTAEFEKRISMRYGDCNAQPHNTQVACKHLQYTVRYDQWKQQVTVQSEPLEIPRQTSQVEFRLTEGSVAERGGPALERKLVHQLAIPGLYSLSIASAEPSIVSNENGEPEHVLHIAASMAVPEREITRVLGAWMLPAKQKPGSDAADFDWAASPEAVNDEVLTRGRKLAPVLIPSELEHSALHSFRLPQAEGGRYLLVRVAKGMKTPGGYQMGEPYQRIVKLKPFPPELSIVGQGALLALSGEKKLPILVRDLPGVQLEIGRLLPAQLQHLISQSEGSFENPRFYNGIEADDLVDRFEKKIPLNLRPGKPHYETVDFGSYLHADAGNRRGVFLLKLRGYDPSKAKKKPEPDAQQPEAEAEEEQGEYDALERYGEQRLVLVTDLGLVMKKSLSGTRDVFVQSIATGQPVAGAHVEIWGRNGQAIATQTTDAAGHAKLPSLAGFQREKAPIALVVRKGGDLSFLPLNRYDRTLDVSRFDVGGLRSAGIPNQMTAYVFSDRGMYRPGETMHIAMMVKAGNWSTSLSDLPMEVEITDARGMSVRREKLRLGPSGAAEIEHSTEDTAPTGNYTVSLYLPRSTSAGSPDAQGLLLGSTTVKVQEFLPDRSKIKLTLNQQSTEGWVRPQDLKALIDVQNLFGTPAPQRKVQATMTLTPAFPSFSAHADYGFYLPQHDGEHQEDELGEQETDDDGKTEFDLRLSRFAPATYQVQVLAKAFEPEGGRSVSAEVRTLVSDQPYLVGVKLDGDARYISKSAVRNAQLIAINPQAQKMALPALKLQRVERKVLSVLVKQGNGLYRYESRRKDVLLDEKPWAIAAAGSPLQLNTATPGNFAYVLRNAQDQVLSRIEYSVAGSANITRSLDRNAELELTLDKKDYAPGQEISVSIRAPYVGAGLITIERDKVYAHSWFKTDKTASVQKITLPKDFEGTGYVSVHFVRDPSSDEIYMSPLSHGVMPFATTLDQRRVKITLTSSELIKPGQPMKMQLTSDKPTRAVVFAVDEGILQVARYKTPDPLKHFFQKRALEVETQQTLDMILPEFKKLMQAAAPGGDGEGALGKHLNPFKRKRDKPVAYWSGLVDVNGSREFSYTVPERFNGSLRVMAVAISDSQAAALSTQTTVRGDMVLLPSAPLAMAPGDVVEVGVGLANNIRGSGKKAPIKLSLSASGGLEVVGEATQTLSVNEGGEGRARFKVRAKPGAQAQLGSAPLVFSASHQGYSTRLSEEVSVRPASPYVSLVQAGSFQRAGELQSQAELYPNFRRSDLAVSAAPWAFATGLMQYLEAYPHGCTEQITSQTFPVVLLSTRPELLKEMQRGRTAEQGPLPTARKTLDRYLVQLRTRQSSEGGFAAWPGGSHADPFATLYAVQLLVEAKQHKLAVPQDLLDQANSYLHQWLGNGGTTPDAWRQRAQAVYLLARQGMVLPSALANLRQSWNNQPALADDLGAAYLAATYLLVKQDKAAKELLDPVWADLLKRVNSKQRRTLWGSYYDPLVHDSMLLHLVARHFPERLKTLQPSVWEGLAGMVRDGWYNSLSSATMLLAVDAYFDAVAVNAAGKLDVQALNAKNQATALALGGINPLARTAVPEGSHKLKLSNHSDFTLYYSWAEQGFERNVPDKALHKGMEIFHDILDAKGQPVTQVKLGDEVTVRVRVRSLDKALIPNVALVDMLPGGLEPVLQSASDASDDEEAEEQESEPLWKKRLASKGSWNLEYADIREDRIVLYGDVGKDVAEITYKARAATVGDYVVPPAYGEAMYDRRVFSRAMGGRLKVVE